MSLLLALSLLQSPSEAELEKLLQRATSVQTAGDRPKAIELFREILSSTKPADAKSSAKYASLRSEAQWNLAVCLEGGAKYEEALAVFREAERCPTGSFCGNAATAHQSASQMGQGRCLEALGRHEEAVGCYFKANEDCLNGTNSAAVRRIVDLYEAAGQVESLKGILLRRDQEFLSHFNAERAKDPSVLQMSPNRPIRELIEVREAARRGEWQKLVALLEKGGSLRFGGMHEPPKVVEAAHLLGAKPEIAVPLLVQKLDSGAADGRSWLYGALGLCGTAEAVKTLRERAEALSKQPWQEQRQWEVEDLCYALRCSELGRKALDQIEANGNDNLKNAAETINRLFIPLKSVPFEFPPIPKDVRLR